jgi:four helix bundle protein
MEARDDHEELLNESFEGYVQSRFLDLECWKKCRELRMNISKMVKNFPTDEKFRLSDQLIRASRSSTNNIAEGYGRYNFKDSAHFFIIARGSISEVIDHLTIARDESFISEQEFLENLQLCDLCLKLTNGYINFLRKHLKKEIE